MQRLDAEPDPVVQRDRDELGDRVGDHPPGEPDVAAPGDQAAGDEDERGSAERGRLGEALDVAVQFPADAVGVVVDTYHTWWDAALLPDIARAGERIVSYQVCDWILPLPADTLLGRGHVGDGHIDFPPITAAVAAAGYTGDIEVEIFNQAIWSAPPAKTAALVRDRFPQVF